MYDDQDLSTSFGVVVIIIIADDDDDDVLWIKRIVVLTCIQVHLLVRPLILDSLWEFLVLSMGRDKSLLSLDSVK